MVWDRPKPGTAGKNAFETVCGILTRKRSGSASIPAKATPKKAKPPAKKKPAGK